VTLTNIHDPRNMLVHKNDLINTIIKLDGGHPGLLQLSYFFNMALKFSFENKPAAAPPQIAIVGLGIPEELIYGVGAQPLWILGGSFGSALYADRFVPRDTDSVSKAALGYLLSEVFTFAQNVALTVIPVTSDSMRKIAYLLSKEREVLAIDIPPVKSDPESQRKWLAEMNTVKNALEQKTKQRLSMASLGEAVKMVNQAKLQMKRILAYSTSAPEIISGVLALFVINTYYFAHNLPEWTAKLKALNDEIAVKMRSTANFASRQRPCIMLAGSPIFFPNFKLPLLLQELNVNLTAYAQEMTRRIDIMPELPRRGERLQKFFETIVLNHYWADCSAAFVDSRSRREYMMALANAIPLNGVIYHVLKGQIEYDFDLEQSESFFNRRDIPFFRLETDFHQQDIEQLKIRLEAFTEMIHAKYYKIRA
jgi:benzoyl-CoA reductase/2-hydroxyglutaryl-CoA dehydratase subunit BcrC/BadD/HgdB